jgi:hypothetical protein
MKPGSRKTSASIRRLFALCFAGLAGACSSQGTSDYSQLFTYAQKSWNGQSQALPAQAQAPGPSAAIAASFGDRPQQVLVLALTSGRQRLWTSPSHIVITTRDGRIVRTVGLAHDLTDLTPASGKTLLPPSAAMAVPVQQNLRADFRGEHLFAEPIICAAHPAGLEEISIFGRVLHTLRVDEDCSATKLNWKFENSYWIGPKSKRVWRSVQHVAPDANPIEIEILRPPQQSGLPTR